MATLTTTRAASDFPVYAGGAGNACVAYGTIDVTAAQSKDDVVSFLKLPKGAVVLGGWLYGADIDTGTEAFELDIGTADDPDMFLNSGVISGDVVAEIKPVAGISQPLGGLLLTDGPQEMTAETTIIGTVVAAANAGGTGRLTLVVNYVMKQTVGA